LDKTLTSNVNRTAELSTHFKEAANHRAKLQHSLDIAESDIVLLKKGLERYDALSQELQQGQEAASTSLQSLTKGCEKTGTDVRTLQHQLLACQQGLADTRDSLDKTTELANRLHSGLQDTDTELRRTCLQLDETETKQQIIKDNLDKTTECVTDLVRGHRKAVNNVQTLQHELGKTNDTLQSARGQIDSTNAGLSGLKGELSRTKDSLERVDRGMESCHQNFSGLRKGFQETGAHLTSRPMTLPKLTQDRLAKAELRGSPGPLKSPTPRGSPGNLKSHEGMIQQISAWGPHVPKEPKDDDASTVSGSDVRTGSRGSSICGNMEADTRRSSMELQ